MGGETLRDRSPGGSDNPSATGNTHFTEERSNTIENTKQIAKQLLTNRLASPAPVQALTPQRPDEEERQHGQKDCTAGMMAGVSFEGR